MQRHTIPLTTDASGNATGFSPVVSGLVNAIIYTKDGTTPFDNGVDFTVTAEATGQQLWAQADVNASATVAPRQATHSTAGVAALYAATGTAVLTPIAVVNDRIKVVVAQGGNTKVGSITVILE